MILEQYPLSFNAISQIVNWFLVEERSARLIRINKKLASIGHSNGEKRRTKKINKER